MPIGAGSWGLGRVSCWIVQPATGNVVRGPFVSEAAAIGGGHRQLHHEPGECRRIVTNANKERRR